MSKVIVTGGAGFIGSTIVDKLIEKGHQVLIIDNLSHGNEKNVNKDAELENLSIQDREKIFNVFDSFRPDYVFHCAAQINVRASITDPFNDVEINVNGSLNLIEAAHRVNAKKFIFSSSGGAAYGDADVIPTPETYKELPISIYGISKLTVDRILYYFKHQFNLDFVSLRYSNVYGPRQNAKGEAGVISIFITKLLNNEPIVINGTGDNTRDFVYVKDVANANILAMESDFTGIVNISTKVETSINKVYETIKSMIDSSSRVSHTPVIVGEQVRSCLDNSYAKQVLNWEPTITFEEGIKNTIEWYRENAR